jgi:hypothetical protein
MKISIARRTVTLSRAETRTLEGKDGPSAHAIKQLARNTAEALANRVGRLVEIYAAAPASYCIDQIEPCDAPGKYL